MRMDRRDLSTRKSIPHWEWEWTGEIWVLRKSIPHWEWEWTGEIWILRKSLPHWEWEWTGEIWVHVKAYLTGNENGQARSEYYEKAYLTATFSPKLPQIYNKIQNNIIPYVGVPRESFPRNFSVKSTICFPAYRNILCPTHCNLLGPITTATLSKLYK